MKLKIAFMLSLFFICNQKVEASYCCSSWKFNHWNQLGISATTYYPLSTGILFDYDINRSFNIGLDVGYMPFLYTNSMNQAAALFGSNWDQKTQDTIQKSLDSSMSISLLFKFFPLRANGLFVSAGYTFLGFGGDFIGVDTLSLMFPNLIESPEGQNLILTQSEVLLETYSHNVRGSIGYRYFINKNIALSGELGVFKTIKVHGNPDEVEPYINDLFVDLLTIPFAGIGIGYYFK